MSLLAVRIRLQSQKHIIQFSAIIFSSYFRKYLLLWIIRFGWQRTRRQHWMANRGPRSPNRKMRLRLFVSIRRATRLDQLESGRPASGPSHWCMHEWISCGSVQAIDNRAINRPIYYRLVIRTWNTRPGRCSPEWSGSGDGDGTLARGSWPLCIHCQCN